MRAVSIEEHGGPEVLQVHKVPNPEIGPLEVLIKVWACGVNHVDLYLRQGIIGANHTPARDPRPRGCRRDR